MSDWNPDIDALQALDDQEWVQVERSFAGRLLAYVARRVPDEAAREDIVQESFLGSVRGIASFDRRYSFEQYLFGICRNRTIDHLRRRRAATIGGVENDEDLDMLETLVQDDETPSAIVQSGDLRERGATILAGVLREWVQETWAAGEFRRLMLIEALFRAGWRNRDTWQRFDLRDETAVAGIKFRALKRLRELASTHDPSGLVLPALADQTREGEIGLEVSTVWRTERVSCPARHWLARQLSGTLPVGPAEFIRFHLEEMECPWCQANLDDLAREEDLTPMLERVRASTAGLLRSKTVGI